MTRRRKVGNLLALAVLAALAERPMHPYEMASVLRARGKDDDMPIKWGSLYTVVQNLEKHGFVIATGSVRQGGRPERTIYEITPDGREELQDWVRELVANPEREHTKFRAALSVLGAITPDEAISLLRQRHALLQEKLSAMRSTLAENLREIPRMFMVEDEYEIAIQQAELTWVHDLLAELTSGSFPGLRMWRDFYQTGAVPPEFADLAERGRDLE
jgi:DNA-binding PadR family transcriptional regulator